MSMTADFSYTLRTTLKNVNSDVAEILINFWVELVESTPIEVDSIISMLEDAKGTDSEINSFLDSQITRQTEFLD